MTLILPKSQSKTKIPFEKIVTSDVKKLAGDYVKGDPEALQRAIDAEVTVNVGLALKVYFKEEHFNRFSAELGASIQKAMLEKLDAV